MKLIRFVLLSLLSTGCGEGKQTSVLLDSDQPASYEKAFCLDKADSLICIPHLNQGKRMFALVPTGENNALENLRDDLRTAMGAATASPTKIEGTLQPGEEELRARHPEHDLYDVSAFFPAIVTKKLNQFANFGGPNCFATALAAAGLIDEEAMLYVSPRELETILSRYFEETAQPRFGDVVVYDVERSKDHAAFYLFDDLVFHKKGYRKGYGFRVTALTKVFAADPFEWQPSPFDSYQPRNDPGFGERPKKYYRRLQADQVVATPEPTVQEAAAIAVIEHIRNQTLRSAPGWSVPRDMGTLIEEIVKSLSKEFSFLATSPSFETRLAYARLESLESQTFQSIDETLYSSPRADESRINEEYCVADNDFTASLLSQFYVYRHGTEPTADTLATMMGEIRGMDRKKCRLENWPSALKP